MTDNAEVDGMAAEANAGRASLGMSPWDVVGAAVPDGDYATRSHGDLEARYRELIAEGRHPRLILFERVDRAANPPQPTDLIVPTSVPLNPPPPHPEEMDTAHVPMTGPDPMPTVSPPS